MRRPPPAAPRAHPELLQQGQGLLAALGPPAAHPGLDVGGEGAQELLQHQELQHLLLGVHLGPQPVPAQGAQQAQRLAGPWRIAQVEVAETVPRRVQGQALGGLALLLHGLGGQDLHGGLRAQEQQHLWGGVSGTVRAQPRLSRTRCLPPRGDRSRGTGAYPSTPTYEESDLQALCHSFPYKTKYSPACRGQGKAAMQGAEATDAAKDPTVLRTAHGRERPALNVDSAMTWKSVPRMVWGHLGVLRPSRGQFGVRLLSS